MTIVIDASVALKWVLDEPGSDAAAALRTEQLIAPAVWLVEAANVLWRLEKARVLSTEQVNTRFLELSNAPIAAVAVEPHLETALALAIRLGHPIYDCLYLALALHRDIRVVTDDRRFAAAADRSEFAGRVRLLEH